MVLQEYPIIIQFIILLFKLAFFSYFMLLYAVKLYEQTIPTAATVGEVSCYYTITELGFQLGSQDFNLGENLKIKLILKMLINIRIQIVNIVKLMTQYACAKMKIIEI